MIVNNSTHTGHLNYAQNEYHKRYFHSFLYIILEMLTVCDFGVGNRTHLSHFMEFAKLILQNIWTFSRDVVSVNTNIPGWGGRPSNALLAGVGEKKIPTTAKIRSAKLDILFIRLSK